MMTVDMAGLVVGTALLSGILALVLFGVKVYHWQRDRLRGARRAQYIAAVGEILARGLPATFDRGWADDPLFHEVLLQYFDVVAGDERAHLEDLMKTIDLRSRLVVRLRDSKRSSSRLVAAAHLATAASPDIEWALLEALHSPSAEIKIHAAAGLASMGSERAIARLVDLILTEGAWVSARIADQLISYGPAAVEPLVGAIADAARVWPREPRTLVAVVRVLGSIGDLRASDAIVPLLGHQLVDVRVAAAGALARAGAPDTVHPLIEALSDSRWEMRARAASSLGAFSDPQAATPLADCLRDASWWVRQNAAESLIEIPGGIDMLIDALEGDDAYARDSALQQLGLNGMIRSARDRIAREEGSDQDHRLVAAVELTPPIPYSERAHPAEEDGDQGVGSTGVEDGRMLSETASL